ncbi:hypothetical protein HELRODRAFT_161005 [Helobdella robusta]|uniref:Alpha/beta hydrolase fold-3 domain-containing protein n=1 Tax=Helobdella robusta TaxID=6412 RepID=T1EQZ9_HELRO|nr:hypothetical protein HELRODRAFT_161005 [Helobdella robusta]ESO01834.1 hypothetical protein HELRODRAFT_161005 [Helobdella robusta]
MVFTLLQTPSATYPLSDGLIVHCHGGGFIAQSSATHSTYLRDWALKTKVPIVSIDYSLAPEFHYPRQVEEIFFAYCWILNNLHIFGSTGSKICFAGDSAGANLATSTVLRTIHEGVRVPDGLLAVYGCFLVSYFPTPSRLLALLDPVLPLGMLPKCVGGEK